MTEIVRTAVVTKLQVGDVIEVHGWVMLRGLEGGRKYRVMKLTEHAGQSAYVFCPQKGWRVAAAHYTTEVDAWVRSADDEDMNKITILYRKGEPYAEPVL